MPVIKTTPEADEDIFRIWQFIARDSPTNANKFIDKMNAVFERMAKMPLAARKRPELGLNIRSRPFNRYVIFYEPLPDGILILHVVHGARDIDSSLFEDN